MKRKVKIFLLAIGIFVTLILILAGSFWYMTKCRYAEVDTQTSGYSEEQITAEMEKRYGNIRACGKEGNLYCYDTGKFSFLVQNDLVMSDNYKMEYYRYLTDSYFAGRNRAHEYEESGD